MATMSSVSSLNSNVAQLLQNQTFEQRLNKLTDAVEALLNFCKYNDYASVNHEQQFARPPQFCEAKRRFSSVSNFKLSREKESNAPQSNRFPARPTTHTDSENLCFFHVRFGARSRKW